MGCQKIDHAFAGNLGAAAEVEVGQLGGCGKCVESFVGHAGVGDVKDGKVREFGQEGLQSCAGQGLTLVQT